MEKGIREMSIEEIEKKLGIVGGDMVKIEFLEGALKHDLPNEVRKYVHIKLADLYTKRLMTGVAARNIESAAEAALTFKEKKELYAKQTELLINSLAFDEAEKSFKKAQQFANTNLEKEDLNKKYKNFFMDKAVEFEKSQNLKKASQMYEKMMFLDPGNIDIKRKLAILYSRLGKIRESIALEQVIKNPKPQVVKKEDFNIDNFLNN